MSWAYIAEMTSFVHASNRADDGAETRTNPLGMSSPTRALSARAYGWVKRKPCTPLLSPPRLPTEPCRSNRLPSASRPGPDILFGPQAPARSPQSAGLHADFPNHEGRLRGPFRAVWSSIRPLSPTQPNHGRFGTDVGSFMIQQVGDAWRGEGLKDSCSGEVNWDRTVRFSVSASGRRADLS
jgi:hypothetical protein